jgi:hypothetical protein
LDWYLLMTLPTPSTVNICYGPCGFKLDTTAVLINKVSVPSPERCWWVLGCHQRLAR